ncbi:phosphate ABC transporter ATP-binding protein [Alteribacter lacisalsi]|uniref:Phosphate ABC transporter ATP-binding protein n=1 Tax=Alteribacter lacisalsi TaxID=2045244 RepID=A0A2W0HP17_9BACI|nr:phosphate ABC transporter ATP-binding protein [Alteribacter lacisalsi]PYZ98619.1 phosphate ABC transporter ATP-binding protein [Alteribacter lacisalsi]
MNGKPILELSNVSTEILSNISLEIYKGEIVTLIGSSGAGKSSLLMLLNRLNDPDTGSIRYRERDLKEYEVTALRKSVGMVFQSSSLFDGTVLDNLKYGPKLFDEWEDGMGSRLMENVQLPKSYLDRNVEDLSGGEKQRVAFARTLANRPDVLLLDEVTSALDLKNVELIEAFIKDLVPDRVHAVIMVTHDVAQAKRLGSRTLFMDEGQIVEQGSTEELFENPHTEKLQYFLKE